MLYAERYIEPQKRAHSTQLAAGLASESKNGKLPYGRRFPAARRRCLQILTLIAVVTCYGLAAHQRNLVWKTDFALWSDCVHKSPLKARPHNYLGLAYKKQGLVDKAIGEYQLGIKMDPRYDEVRINLGISFFDKGDVDHAIAEFRSALATNPYNALAHYNLGIAYGSKGLYEKAFQEMKMAKALSSKGKWNLMLGDMKPGRRMHP